MAEIKCPNCGKIFKIDDADYASIVSQIKNEEMEKEINFRVKEKEENINKANQLLIKENDDKNQSMIDKLNLEIEKLKQYQAQAEKEKQNEISLAVSKEKENSIQTKDDLNKKIKELEKENSSLKNENEKMSLEQKNVLSNLENQKNSEIQDLKNKVENLNKEKQYEIKNAISDKEKEILELKSSLKIKDQEKEIQNKTTEEKYQIILKQKEQEIEFYKDLKTKMSTKLIGETLEQHCFNEFNKIRMQAYPYAKFDKDNEVSKESGSKGDFIFRNYDETQTNEIVSIMFEMKNEMDTTATKHKNSDFFKELDKDRKEKKCEYAVLVSMLEPDNEFYNAGIVDVSYEYEKMFVVRPQCFLSIIALLSSANKNALSYKKELMAIKNQEVDVTNFENKLLDFQEKFGKNYDLASKKFINAIEEIDKTITHLNKIKDSLISAENNLRLANNKAQDLSIKKLTKDNPTMKNKFEELK